jgi:hypothetical protein
VQTSLFEINLLHGENLSKHATASLLESLKIF